MAKRTKAAEEDKAVGVNALTIYFFAVINGKRFPAQQTLTCENVDDFTRLLPDFYGAFGEAGEDDYVTFEPRGIGPASARAAPSGGSAQGGGGQRQQERVTGPNCPFHGTPTTQKNGRNGPFFSCSKRREDGSWCNWTPEQEGN